MSDVARLSAVLTAGFTLGATAWFFFLQSPVLIKFMGKKKFIPVQMHLTKALFTSLEIACLANTVLTYAFVDGNVASQVLGTSCLALISVVINRRVVVPMALEAGARSIREDDHTDTSAVGFAKDGGGNSTQTLHRTVVLFVVAMLVGTVGHLHAVVSSASRS